MGWILSAQIPPLIFKILMVEGLSQTFDLKIIAWTFVCFHYFESQDLGPRSLGPWFSRTSCHAYLYVHIRLYLYVYCFHMYDVIIFVTSAMRAGSSAMQCSIVQCSAVQCSAVQRNAKQCSAARTAQQCSKVTATI